MNTTPLPRAHRHTTCFRIEKSVWLWFKSVAAQMGKKIAALIKIVVLKELELIEKGNFSNIPRKAPIDATLCTWRQVELANALWKRIRIAAINSGVDASYLICIAIKNFLLDLKIDLSSLPPYNDQVSFTEEDAEST